MKLDRVLGMPAFVASWSEVRVALGIPKLVTAI